jgi:DNA-binding GntR family transcriptional regulator
MILGGELQAGAKVNEQSLVARLGDSCGPIREAHMVRRVGSALVESSIEHAAIVDAIAAGDVARAGSG